MHLLECHDKPREIPKVIELEESGYLAGWWVAVLIPSISIQLYPELVSIQLVQVVAEYCLELVHRQVHSENEQD